MSSPSGSDAHAIVTEGLRRRFGKRYAVDGLDLRVRAGEIYGFLGPNGAGKSTSVRMLCTLLTPTSGRATVAGHDVVRESLQVRLRIGAALQSTALDDSHTGRELLRLQGRFYGLRPRQIDQRVAELADLIDLGEALDRRVGGYSGGMRRRLDLALALIHRPEVVFLDEPTTGLDPASRLTLWQEIRRLNREQGTTVLLTTQYLEEADELADRVGIINQGKVVAEGTPEELKRTVGTDLVVVVVRGDGAAAAPALSTLEQVEKVEVTGSEVTVSVRNGPVAISEVALALAGAGVPVEHLTLRRPTLDDVFLSITGHHISPSDDADHPATESREEVRV